jgi:hypothetical protein
MSDNCREILRDALVFIIALALGLAVASIIVRLDEPQTPAGPLERAIHPQP